MDAQPRWQIKGRIDLGPDGQGPLEDQRIELLERIGKTGSISQAAKAVGMSYRAAWNTVDALRNQTRELACRTVAAVKKNENVCHRSM